MVSQGASSRQGLEDLRDFFDVGRVYANPRSDDHREHMAQFVVSRREDLLTTIIPFFESYPLRTAKRLDFEKFARCVRMIDAGVHLTAGGLADIACVSHADDEPEEVARRADQNPQRPYAGGPGHWIMRWSHLHGDMQRERGALEDAPSTRAKGSGKAKAKFLVG